MNRKYVLRIKNPRLRRFRDNLRKVLYLAWQRELERLETLMDNIRENPYLSMEKSIVYCQACWRIDMDMIYNPLMRMWYCSDCYRELHEIYEKEPNPDYGQLFP
ncbi:MAG: hypothetical protein ACTSRH_19230 [Promethearchaeota archaeon]